MPRAKVYYALEKDNNGRRTALGEACTRAVHIIRSYHTWKSDTQNEHQQRQRGKPAWELKYEWVCASDAMENAYDDFIDSLVSIVRQRQTSIVVPAGMYTSLINTEVALNTLVSQHTIVINLTRNNRNPDRFTIRNHPTIPMTNTNGVDRSKQAFQSYHPPSRPNSEKAKRK
jgi:hypothetical protein